VLTYNGVRHMPKMLR